MDILSNPTTKTNLAANRVYASPNLASGNATFRQMTENDLPLITGVSLLTPAYNDSLLIGDAAPSQNGRATISTVLSLALQGFVSGLGVEWVSATQLKLLTGAAHIQSGDVILKLTADSTKTLSSLSANTWYYVYVFESSGALDWEHSTTAPAAPYFGAARSKTGDSSRRFVFCFRTNASGQLYNFLYNPLSGEMNYQIDYSVSPFRIVGPGQSTSFTTVNASAVAPPISTLAVMRIQNYSLPPTHTTGTGRVTIPSDTGVDRLIVNIDADSTYSIAMNSSQQISYKVDGGIAGAGGLYIDVKAFFFAR